MTGIPELYDKFYAQAFRASDGPESPRPDRDEYRSPFLRDRDRVLYSSAFRRLAGVTQVTAVREQTLLHNRLTHSLKVAQTARSLAERLIGLPDFTSDLDDVCHSHLPQMAETAGLAHDLGHPPFGHIAEKELQRIMSSYGGFEGNAQSLRIITKIASRAVDTYGLSLTRASLNGVLKYPQFRAEVEYGKLPPRDWTNRAFGSKWGVYGSERAEFDFARQREAGAPRDLTDRHKRCVAAILMDWADDVSFATHDLDDYYRGKLIPLHKIADDSRTPGFLEFARQFHKDNGLEACGLDENKFALALERIKRTDTPKEAFHDTRDQRIEINNWVSTRIKEYVRAVTPGTAEEGFVHIDENRQYEVEVLKMLNWYHVINKPALAVAQNGQRKMISNLFDELFDLSEKHKDQMKTDLRTPVPQTLCEMYKRIHTHESPDAPEEMPRARAICDYICTLTEQQTVDLYERITGYKLSQRSIFGAWF
jgi:dGTPase